MTKNQKIAAGCGGLGCLGLIVLAIAGTVGYFVFYQPARERRVNINVSSNSNSNSNRNANSNTNTSESNNNSTNSTSSNPSSYSEDEKHRLWQAASKTGDVDLIQKVVKKTGLFTEAGVPAEGYAQFIRDHTDWAIKNADWINTIDTPEKARAYVDEHL